MTNIAIIRAKLEHIARAPRALSAPPEAGEAPQNKPSLAPPVYMHTYEVHPRTDHRGVDLIFNVLPFGRPWYGQRNADAKRDVDGKWKFGLDFAI